MFMEVYSSLPIVSPQPNRRKGAGREPVYCGRGHDRAMTAPTVERFAGCHAIVIFPFLSMLTLKVKTFLQFFPEPSNFTAI